MMISNVFSYFVTLLFYVINFFYHYFVIIFINYELILIIFLISYIL